MDAPGIYTGGSYTQHLSPRQIEKMRKNMKKVPIIQAKSETYHKKEKEEAEKIIDNQLQFTSEYPQIEQLPHDVYVPWYRRLYLRLRTLSKKLYTLIKQK